MVTVVHFMIRFEPVFTHPPKFGGLHH